MPARTLGFVFAAVVILTLVGIGVVVEGSRFGKIGQTVWGGLGGSEKLAGIRLDMANKKVDQNWKKPTMRPTTRPNLMNPKKG